MKTAIFILLVLIYTQITFSQEKSFPEITLINSIEFMDGSIAPSYPGCSFLLDVGYDTLAVTCKHALWAGKNEKMKSISFSGQIKEWRMFAKYDTSNYIIVDKLINENKDEAIGEWNTEKDYLLFTIKENHSNIKLLKLNTKKLTTGEELYKVGWAFSDKEGPQRIYKSKFYKHLGNAMLVEDEVRENQAGTSGSPVVTESGAFSGIVSSWKYDPQSAGWYPAPCSTDYLWEIVYEYWLAKQDNQKSVESFVKFIKEYEQINECSVEFSNNLLANIFFSNWLRENKVLFGLEKHYNEWAKAAGSILGKEIKINEELKNNLVFNSWKKEYVNDEAVFSDLEKLGAEKKVYVDVNMICKFAIDLARKGNFEKATAVAEQAAIQFPKAGQVYFYLGEINLENGKKEIAISNYNKCLELYPGYPFAVERLKSMDEL